ncbi:hypothetical protein [Photobacterium leiognathi]|uniref:hypothetical protein n=1 Tax=Photobacterium leiognathi TaxID=553611 RepID=UPI0029822B5F|nr:hypothetical protein [Photobacterium leiognathi]
MSLFKVCKLLLCVIACVVMGSAHATQIKVLSEIPKTSIVEVKQTFNLGDADTLAFARDQNLKNAKLAVAERFGSYIERITVVEKDSLTKDEIKSIAVAHVTLLSNKQHINSENGHVSLTSTINFEVDKAKIKESIADIKNDESLKLDLAKIKKEHQDLKSDYYKLSNNKIEDYADQLSKDLNAALVSSKMNFNDDELLDISKLHMTDYERVKNKIFQVFNEITEIADVSYSSPHFTLDGKNKDHTRITTDVTWNINKDKLINNLKPYFKVRYSKLARSVNIYYRDSHPNVYSKQVLRELFDKRICLQGDLYNRGTPCFKNTIAYARDDMDGSNFAIYLDSGRKVRQFNWLFKTSKLSQSSSITSSFQLRNSVKKFQPVGGID